MIKHSLFISIVILLMNNLLSAQNLSSTESDQLVFAHVIFRHGDRSGLFPYPNDPYKGKEYFPDGKGQLTKAGKLHQYQLGKYLRKRYYKFLDGGRYSPDTVYVQSSNTDRTIMSAAANLAGFFPPEKNQIWNDEMPNWLPIPIHTIPLELDHIIAAERPCPRYEKAHREQMASSEFKALVNTVSKYLKLIEEKAGFENASFRSLLFTWDTLYAQKSANLTLPQWSSEIMASNSSAVNFVNQLFRFLVRTKEMQRLKGGFLLREMLERFTNKTESKLNPDLSLWIYSAHDLNIIYLLSSLGLFEPHVPPFASCLFFELFKARNNSYYMQVFYKNSTSEESLPPLNIPGCGIQCPLDKFHEIFKDVIPSADFETECKLPESTDSNGDMSFISNKKDLIFPICCTIIIILSTIYGWREQSPINSA